MKLIIIVNLFIVLQTVTIAYDLVTPYNEKLDNEHSQLYQQHNDGINAKARYRRDEEAVNFQKYRRKSPPCCAEEVFKQLYENGKNLKEECSKQIINRTQEFGTFNYKEVEQRRKYIACFLKCVGQKKNILDGDGNPSEAGFSRFVSEIMAKEKWFTNIQNQVINTCISEVQNILKAKDSKNSTDCNPAGMKLIRCLFREIQFGCPNEEIKDHEACSSFRSNRRNHLFRQENHL